MIAEYKNQVELQSDQGPVITACKFWFIFTFLSTSLSIHTNVARSSSKETPIEYIYLVPLILTFKYVLRLKHMSMTFLFNKLFKHF